jgi:hypothetical protein
MHIAGHQTQWNLRMSLASKWLTAGHQAEKASMSRPNPMAVR